MSKINQTTWIVALSTIDSTTVDELVEPEVPGIVTITNPEGGKIINFTAGTEGTSPITSYVATSVPEGPTLTVVSPDLAIGGYVELSNFTFDVNYVVSISAVNEVGQGEAASTNSFIIEDVYNAANGGTETIVYDYNGTGERWKVHTFLAEETFEVTSSPNPFSVLIVGNGGSGGVGNGCGVVYWAGGSGGGGGVYTNESMYLTNAAYPVGTWSFNGESAGNGGNGQGSGNGQNGGSSGYPTSFGGGTTGPPGTYGYASGGGGGAGGSGGNSDSFSGGLAGPGVVRNITGSNATYGQGGRGQDGNGCNGNVGLGFPGSQTGGVIIAYKTSNAFNAATGGTITIIDDFESTGEKWAQHTFTASDTFALSSAQQPIKVRLIAKGGSSGYADCPMSGGTNGGGAGAYEWDGSLTVGDYAVTVGTANSKANTNGGSSTVEGVGTVGGGGNGLRHGLQQRCGAGCNRNLGRHI